MATPKPSARTYGDLTTDSESESPANKRLAGKEDVTNKDLKAILYEQFKDLKSELQATKADLQKEISELRDEVHAKENQIRNLEGNLQNVSTDLEKALAKMDRQQEEIEKLKYTVDDNEQHGRRWALRISGLNLDGTMDYNKLVMDLGNEIKVNLKSSDIDRAHPVGVKKEILIVKFTNYSARSALYEARRKLKDREPAVYINEDLTRTRYGILKSLLKLRARKLVNDVWTKDGRIFTNVNGERLLIRSCDDVEKLSVNENNPLTAKAFGRYVETLAAPKQDVIPMDESVPAGDDKNG